ncbi:serine protease [Fusobacterium necrophorum DAB]|uniref:autotransporter domain-containing protein n=1 Tax=Fusobacterium necrophorum TaxID=859 RepID=UPI0004613DCB|nr:autotransporter domain-containing protein [Fusobacterium necrophorum]KDE67451.1 serine protease [Fusobacterium necrophorum DAB]MBR8732495.1 Extracellular serine protease [Fusobacterium necrophorum]MBR8788671.1 Extracellular serine protease [Fusobacterium necrophorum]
MKKRKEVMALFFLVTALIGTSCSSGGGGHGGSGPGVDSVPIGSVRDKKGGITKPDVKMGFPVVSNPELIVSVTPNTPTTPSPSTPLEPVVTPSIITTDPSVAPGDFVGGKRQNQVQLNSVEIPKDANNYNGSGVTVAVMDSDFVSYKFENSLRTDKLKGRFQQYEEIGPGSGTQNGSDHGYRVARVVADIQEGIAKGANIVGTTFGIRSGSGVGIRTDANKYLELFKKRPDIKIFNQSFGQTMDITRYKAYIQNQLYRYYGNIEENFKRVLEQEYSHYKKGVNEDRLFIWAAGNTAVKNRITQYFDNPMVEAGLPYYMKELEKGWLAVVGLDLRNPDEPKEFENGKSGGHLARAGVAANWAIATDGIMDIKHGIEGYDSDARKSYHKTDTVTIAGSSFAAPKVAGAAALIKQKYPWMGANELRQTILTTAKEVEDLYRSTNRGHWVPIGNHMERWENYNERRHLTKEQLRNIYGWGILDVNKAINGPAKFDRRLTTLTDVNGRFKANIADANMRSIFSNDISGDGGLYKTGKGSLALTGDNSYTGSTVVHQGNLEVYKGLKSDVTIDKEGRLILSQNSRLANVSNGGTVENIGSGAIIQGNYNSTANSLLIADVGSRLKIQGTTRLENGSTLAVLPQKYVSSTAVSTPMLESAGGVQGLFDVVLAPAMIKTKIDQSGNQINLTVQRRNVEEVMSGQGESVENVARNLEEAYKDADEGKTNLSFKNTLAELQGIGSTASLAGYMSSLSGEVYASAQLLTFQQTQAVNRDLSNRMASLSNLDGKHESSVWMSYINANGRISQKGYDKANTRLNSGQFGLDTKVGKNSILGVAINYSKANAYFDHYAGTSESDGIGVSVYGRHKLTDNLYAQGRIGIASLSTDVERQVLNGHSNIHHHDILYSAYAEVGYDMKKDNFKVTPFVGFSHDMLKRGSFDENVNDLSISANKKTYHKDMIVVGMKAQYDIAHDKGRATHLMAEASVGKNLSSRNLDFKASYDGHRTEEVEFKGAKMPDYTVWTGIGVEHDFTDQFSMYTNYDLKVENDKIADKVASVGFKYKF